MNMLTWLSGIGTFLLGAGTFMLGGAAVWTLIRGMDRFRRKQLELQKDKFEHDKFIQEQKFLLEKNVISRAYRFNLAVRAASLFGQIKDAFSEIRMRPLIFNFQDKTIEYEKGFKERILPYNKLFESISELRPEFFATFDTEKPFRILLDIVAEIKSESMLLDYYNDESCEDITEDEREDGRKKAIRFLFANVFIGGDDMFNEGKDDVSEKIDSAVKEIEEICFDILREKKGNDLPSSPPR